MNTNHRKVKIVFIIADFGSYENFIAELSLRMIEEYGFLVTVICAENKVINFKNKFIYEKEDLKFRFIEMPRGFNLLKQIKGSRQINKIIEEENPDIVHAHFTTSIFTTVLLKKRNIDILGTFHGLGFVATKGIKKVLLYLIEIFCFFRLKKIIVLNTIDFSSIPKIFQSKRIKQKSLGLGCNLKLFDRNRFSYSYIRERKKELDLEDTFVIAFTGRYVDFKGFDIVAKTFMRLASEGEYRIKLILIGGKDAIHKTGLGIEEEKSFFKNKDVLDIGFTNKVESYLVLSDLFFFPSSKEGIPISITEALAMGIPVLTYNSRGCNDLVSNGYNGILVDPSLNMGKDIDKFCQIIKSGIRNRKMLIRMSARSLDKRERLSRENFINENISWYLNQFT